MQDLGWWEISEFAGKRLVVLSGQKGKENYHGPKAWTSEKQGFLQANLISKIPLILRAEAEFSVFYPESQAGHWQSQTQLNCTNK